MLKTIPPSQVELGMFVHKLEGSWLKHPFWKSRFLLDDPETLADLRDADIRGVVIDVSKGRDVAPAQPQVRRVLFPALPSDPGHALWRAQFSGAAGPFTFELAPCGEAAFAAFIDALALFGLGTSWGGYESLVLPAVPYDQRHLATLPDEGRLVRLHVGLEDARDLRHLLAQTVHRPTWLAAHAERAVSRALGGSCSMPLAAHATWDGGTLHLEAALGHATELTAPLLRFTTEGAPADEAAARRLGEEAAEGLRKAGAAGYLATA